MSAEEPIEFDPYTGDPMYFEPTSSLWDVGFVFFTVLSFMFWIWMCLDCYRRLGGLNVWHLLFFFLPFSSVVYFLIHFKEIIGGRGGAHSGALFGPSLKSQIRDKQAQLRIADTIAARFELGELLFRYKDYTACEAEFRVVLLAEPNNLEAQYFIGLCRMRLNDPAEALPFLKEVVQGDRKIRMGLAWKDYTDCLIANKLLDEALEERRKLARAFPRPLTEYAYAELLKEMGQKEKAREILDDMLATSHNAPREDNTWLRQGRSLLRQL
jgi:hypothetical protein